MIVKQSLIILHIFIVLLMSDFSLYGKDPCTETGTQTTAQQLGGESSPSLGRAIISAFCPLRYILYFFWGALCFLFMAVVVLADILTLFAGRLTPKVYSDIVESFQNMEELFSFCYFNNEC